VLGGGRFVCEVVAIVVIMTFARRGGVEDGGEGK
jgi:hypothetical protein